MKLNNRTLPEERQPMDQKLIEALNSVRAKRGMGVVRLPDKVAGSTYATRREEPRARYRPSKSRKRSQKDIDARKRWIEKKKLEGLDLHPSDLRLPQEAIAGVSSVPTVKVDIVANLPQGSHTGPWRSLPNQPVRQESRPARPPIAAPASCPVPKAVEVYEGIYTAQRAMQIGLVVTPDRTRYKDSGAWFRCVPE